MILFFLDQSGLIKAVSIVLFYSNRTSRRPLFPCICVCAHEISQMNIWALCMETKLSNQSAMCLMLKRVSKECSENTSLRIFVKISIGKACLATLLPGLEASSKSGVLCMKSVKRMKTPFHLPEPPGSLSHMYPRHTHTALNT